MRGFVNHLCHTDPPITCTEAARRAGYKRPSRAATLLLSNPLVRAEVSDRMSKALKAAQITTEHVLMRIEDVRQAAYDKKDYGNALKALELQGRYLKMFTERHEFSVPVEQADDKQLIKMFKDVAKLMGSNHPLVRNARRAIAGADQGATPAASDAVPAPGNEETH